MVTPLPNFEIVWICSLCGVRSNSEDKNVFCEKASDGLNSGHDWFSRKTQVDSFTQQVVARMRELKNKRVCYQDGCQDQYSTDITYCEGRHAIGIQWCEIEKLLKELEGTK